MESEEGTAWMGQPAVSTPRMLKEDRLPQVSTGLEVARVVVRRVEPGEEEEGAQDLGHRYTAWRGWRQVPACGEGLYR